MASACSRAGGADLGPLLRAQDSPGQLLAMGTSFLSLTLQS